MPRCCSSVVRKEGHHFWLIRFLRTSVVALRPATGDAVPGPGPQTQRIAFGNPTWHFSLFASSMIVRERRWRRRVSSRTGSAEDRANADLGSQASHRSVPSMLMLLAQSEKCRGAGGRAPIAQGSARKPYEPPISFARPQGNVSLPDHAGGPNAKDFPGRSVSDLHSDPGTGTAVGLPGVFGVPEVLSTLQARSVLRLYLTPVRRVRTISPSFDLHK
jgi:hypothetical protein